MDGLEIKDIFIIWKTMRFTVKIEKIVYGGYGLGYHEGKTVLVYKGMPGEVLEVEVVEDKKNVLFCIIPSKSTCGACVFSEIDYPQQIEYKKLILNEIFKNIYSNIDMVSSPQVNYYRNKITFSVEYAEDKVKIGMVENKSNKVIEYDSCLLYPAGITDLVNYFRDLLNNKPKVIQNITFRYNSDLSAIHIYFSSNQKFNIFTEEEISNIATPPSPSQRGGNIVGIVFNDKVLYGEKYYYDKFAHLKLKIHFKAFYQTNTQQAINIYQQIEKFIDVNEIVLDAYCGMGTIGLFISKKCKNVVCIDDDKSSIISGLGNAKINKIKNLQFVNKNCNNVLENLEKVNTVIVNPPRQGLNKKIIQDICSLKINKVIYLSCDPMTLKRDILLFKDKGYNLNFLKGFDMFPHTWHIETLALLKFNNGDKK